MGLAGYRLLSAFFLAISDAGIFKQHVWERHQARRTPLVKRMQKLDGILLRTLTVIVQIISRIAAARTMSALEVATPKASAAAALRSQKCRHAMSWWALLCRLPQSAPRHRLRRLLWTRSLQLRMRKQHPKLAGHGRGLQSR